MDPGRLVPAFETGDRAWFCREASEGYAKHAVTPAVGSTGKRRSSALYADRRQLRISSVSFRINGAGRRGPAWQGEEASCGRI
jgi:hypothetical protein